MTSANKSVSSARQQEYARLRTQLAQTGWISEGSVQDRKASGQPFLSLDPKSQREDRGVALSKEHYDWLKQAIGSWRAVQQTLREMQRRSRAKLFESLPQPKRRNRLGKNARPGLSSTPIGGLRLKLRVEAALLSWVPQESANYPIFRGKPWLPAPKRDANYRQNVRF